MSNLEKFPDGSVVESWFYQVKTPFLNDFNNKYVISDYGVESNGSLQTNKIQAVIDLAYKNGGGLIIIPKGTYLTGALFFKQNVHLYLDDGAILLGSDDINDYPLIETRIEGETCLYYPGLINADNVDGFIAFGKGVIDGNGLKSWKSFWERRKWNPKCTNKDEQRNRLIYISNSKNILIYGLSFKNSPFWTTHIYKCHHVKFIDLNISSPKEPVPAPSTDGIDIDACKDVLIKGCCFEVNDDGVALKGGKGPYADEDPNNGENERIIIEDCRFGFCHSVITCGSESIHNKNILVRRVEVNNTLQLIHLKLRPDTLQHYEYIKIDGVKGNISHSFININPWTQFYDLKGREDLPISKVHDIDISNCNCKCGIFFNVSKSDKYMLYRFKIENLNIITNDKCNDFNVVDDIEIKNVNVKEINEND